MNKIYKFKTRNEVVEFLKGYDFKYYVPRLEEEMQRTPVKNKYYTIEVSKNNKIIFCAIEKDGDARNAYTDDCVPFYDCNKAKNYYKEKEGEENYKEWLEMQELLFEE